MSISPDTPDALAGASRRTPLLIAGGLAAGGALAVLGWTALSGGSSTDTAFAVPAPHRGHPVATASPSPGSSTLPAVGRSGRDPFLALYNAPAGAGAGAAVAGRAAPGASAPPVAGAVAPAAGPLVAAPVVVPVAQNPASVALPGGRMPGGAPGSALTGGPGAGVGTGVEAPTVARPPVPTRLELVSVTGTGRALVGHFLLDGAATDAKPGAALGSGAGLQVVSLQQGDTGWTAVLTRAGGTPFDVTSGTPVSVG